MIIFRFQGMLNQAPPRDGFHPSFSRSQKQGDEPNPPFSQHNPLRDEACPHFSRHDPQGDDLYPLFTYPDPLGDLFAPHGDNDHKEGDNRYPHFSRPVPFGDEAYPLGDSLEKDGDISCPLLAGGYKTRIYVPNGCYGFRSTVLLFSEVENLGTHRCLGFRFAVQIRFHIEEYDHTLRFRGEIRLKSYSNKIT